MRLERFRCTYPPVSWKQVGSLRGVHGAIVSVDGEERDVIRVVGDDGVILNSEVSTSLRGLWGLDSHEQSMTFAVGTDAMVLELAHHEP
ncbi:MAG: hypothetical protein V3T05_13370 [Myxococcota bacterium]